METFVINFICPELDLSDENFTANRNMHIFLEYSGRDNVQRRIQSVMSLTFINGTSRKYTKNQTKLR